MEEDFYIVRISDHALMELVLAALEGYVVKEAKVKPGRKKEFVETFGVLWGHKTTLPYGWTLFSVENVTVDAMADRNRNWVAPSSGQIVKQDFVSSFWPHLEFLGDLHTHPYKHYSEVDATSYSFSENDRKSIEHPDDHPYPEPTVCLVVTIAGLRGRSDAMPEHLEGNCLVFTLGYFRFWIKAYLTIPVADDEQVLGAYVIPRHEEWPNPADHFPDEIDPEIFMEESTVTLEIPSVFGLAEISRSGRIDPKGLYRPGDI